MSEEIVAKVENKAETEEGIIDLSSIMAAQQECKNYLVRNHYYFNDEVTSDTTRALIVNLHELTLRIVKESLETGLEPCPIELHINSCGGDLVAALQIVQTMENIQTGRACMIGESLVPIRINTHIEGEADSAASLIAACGSYRTISKYALSLIHSMRSLDAKFKTVEEAEVAISNDKKWNEVYKNIYLSHSSLKKEELEEMFKTETYYTPEEIVKFGLAEEIV